MIKKLTLALFISLLVVVVSKAAVPDLPAQRSETIVLASLDVVQALGEALTEQTSIRVLNAIPQGYSMQGQRAYLKKHQDIFSQLAEHAAGVLSVTSAWSDDPLYQWARRANIRIVNIDVTKPLDGYGAGVPLLQVEGAYSPYVWRSPANLTRMAMIAADDLSRLVPHEAQTIQKNLRKLQSALFQLRSRYEKAFTQMELVDFAALTGDYTYLTDEFGLDIRFYALKPEGQWTAGEEQALSQHLSQSGIAGVICPWEPEEKGRQVIREGGAVPIVLKRYVSSLGVDPVTSLVRWYDDNLSQLLGALKTTTGG